MARQDAAAASALQGRVGGVFRIVTSATFYPVPPGEQPDEGDQARPRANLVMRSALPDEVEVVRGTMPSAHARGASGPVPVAIGEETATAQRLDLGTVLDLYPFWDDDAPPLQVQIAGTI